MIPFLMEIRIIMDWMTRFALGKNTLFDKVIVTNLD